MFLMFNFSISKFYFLFLLMKFLVDSWKIQRKTFHYFFLLNYFFDFNKVAGEKGELLSATPPPPLVVEA